MDKQDYADEKVTSTYEFINFIDSKAQFLKEYLEYLHDEDENLTKYNDEDYIETNDYNEYNSLIDRCEEIIAYREKRGINYDDSTFNTYRAEVMPLMEWITQEYPYMKNYYEKQHEEFIKSLNQKRNNNTTEKGGKKPSIKGKKGNKNKTKKSYKRKSNKRKCTKNRSFKQAKN
jgi:hypothetical protein